MMCWNCGTEACASITEDGTRTQYYCYNCYNSKSIVILKKQLKEVDEKLKELMKV